MHSVALHIHLEELGKKNKQANNGIKQYCLQYLAKQIDSIQITKNGVRTNTHDMPCLLNRCLLDINDLHRPRSSLLMRILRSQMAHLYSFVARTLLGAKGIATRSKDATRGSWPYY